MKLKVFIIMHINVLFYQPITILFYFVLVIRTLNHPFHLHGYGMYVVGMGQHPDRVPMTRALASQMLQGRSLQAPEYAMPANHFPPIKDTISIPSRGYITLRFRASNPGNLKF